MPEESLRVFVSYTGEDLHDHAEAAITAVNSAGCVPVQFKFWEDGSGQDVVRRCLAEVRSCQLLLVLVAHRHGWTPEREEHSSEDRVHADGAKSMVRLEVEQAERDGLPVLPFLIDHDHAWRPRLIDGRGDKERHEALAAFVESLQTPGHRRRIVQRFTDARSLGPLVKEAVSRWKAERQDPVQRYLAAVRDSAGHVDLLGFGHDRNVQLPIERVYVQLSLTSASPEHAEEGDGLRHGGAESVIQLPEVLTRIEPLPEPAAVLLGVPGCGKSTGLRRLAWECAQPERREELPGLRAGTVPILLRLRSIQSGALPNDWPRFVAEECEKWLSIRVEVESLLASPVLWLLDGLDEIADPEFRSRFLGWLRKQLAKRWEKGDRLVVSSRPEGWSRGDAAGGSFLEMKVKLLESAERDRFVELWHVAVAAALQEPAEKALDRVGELKTLLAERNRSDPLFSEIVGNPLLLTILCFLHRDRVELPRRRAALYDRCLTVLLSQWRKDLNPAHGDFALDESAAREVLKPLAWWLQDSGEASAAPVGAWVDHATAALASLSEGAKLGRDGRAFLERIRLESGLVQEASAGQLCFLHATFQEYLAGRFAIDEGRLETLVLNFGTKRWHELTLLALSDAPRSFARRFFELLLAGEAWFEHGEHFQGCLAESMHVPIEPFVEALRRHDGEKRRALLTAVAHRTDGPLLELAEEWKDTADQETRAAAQGILERAPASYRFRPEPVKLRLRATETRLSPGESRIVERAGIALVWIPPGEFDMGSATGHADERPVRRITIKTGFWLAKHPVTNAEYARYLEATNAPAPEYWNDRDFNRPNQPVVGVSWDDAQAYCRWAGLVLPSEAWWEYACRGSTEPTRTRYWNGDTEFDLAEVGWYGENSASKLQPVAQKRANAFGLFDVHGNVWEWCEDSWHGSYVGAPSGEGARLDNASGSRVVRGGSFSYSADAARSAFRLSCPRSTRGIDLGFRPAQAVTPKPPHFFTPCPEAPEPHGSPRPLRSRSPGAQG